MGRQTWLLVKQSRRFYISSYRRVGTTLLVSVGLNLLLGVGIYFVYFNRSEPDFYATSGIIAPVSLTPMDSPNNTSVALLASDPDN